MLRLHLVSDLHLDHDEQQDEAFLRDYKNEDSASLLVVAGDSFSTFRGAVLRELVDKFAGMYEDVIFLPGNHEYWLCTPEAANSGFDSMASEHVHVFATPQFKTVQGQRFLGATMWYPQPAKRKKQEFVDMRQIHTPRKWLFDEFQRFRSLLDTVEKTDVVITHHLPHPMSTPARFRGSEGDHFFMTNLTGPIMDLRPKLWLHGHTHDPCDYTIGDTRVVCNPRGYPFEYKVRPPYKPLLIEV